MSYSLYQHEMSKGTPELEQGVGQNTMDATQTFLNTVDGIPNSGVSAGYAALDSIAGDIGAPLQFSSAIDIAQRQFGNRATLQFIHRQQLHQVARAGLRDVGQPYPFLAEIQRSFGQHDISGLESHTGEAARVANSELGSTAYHKGGHVAFGQAPTLADAAHEAAHYVQGVGAAHLEGGVGQAGDVYERHADRVSAAVVAGESAELLLDRSPGGGGSPATETDNAPVQMTGGSLSRIGGMGRRGFASRGRWGLGLGAGLGLAALAGGLYARTGRQQEEPPKQTGPMLSEGGARGNVKLSGPQFFDSTVDFASYVSMLQHRTQTMRNRDANFYTPFTHVNDYKYGVPEALVAQTGPEVIEENLKRIEEQYGGVKPEPGTMDLYRETMKNSRGQYMGLAHLTGRVNMGDRSLHSHLRADVRQLIETDEEGKEVMGDDGKPKRRFIRPFMKPKDFGVPEGTTTPSDLCVHTFIEDYHHSPTHYKGAKIRNHPPADKTFIPMVRFSGIELPEAFSALMLAELGTGTSMGAYTLEQLTCVPWPLELLGAGGADMGKISPEFASGERDLQNPEMTIELDRYLAHHTTHHPDRKVLRDLRDQDAKATDKEGKTVLDKDGKPLPLNNHEADAYEFFHSYQDTTKPWLESQDAPWPWEKGHYKRAISSQTYGPKFGPFRTVDEFRRHISMIQRWVEKQKTKDPEYAMRLTFDQFKYGVMEAVIAHTEPAVIEANLKRIEDKYSGVKPVMGTATYYHYVVYGGKGLGGHGQHIQMHHPSVEVKMGNLSAHSDLRGDSRLYPKDEEKWKGMTEEEQKKDRKSRRLRPKIKPADYGQDLGADIAEMTIMERPDTSFPDFENYPVTEDIVKEIARFENIPLPEAFTALLLMEFWHLASIGPYDRYRTTCFPVCLDVLAAGGVDLEQTVPAYAQGSRSIMDPELVLGTDRFLAFHGERHVNQEVLDSMRDRDATVVSPVDNKERPLNLLGGETIADFLRVYGGLRPWDWPKEAPWPWDREYWDDETKKSK